MQNEQTPAAGPLTAESVALLKKGDLLRDLDGVSIFNDTHDGWVQTIDAKGVRMSFQPKHITFLGRPDQDGWIAWSGGENPVPGQKVEVRTRKGEIRSAISESFGIMWMADGHESDIIAYRPHVASPASSSSVVQGDASGVSEWNDDDAKRYIADWCPDYVKDYIDRLSTPAPVSRPAGEGEREAVARLLDPEQWAVQDFGASKNGGKFIDAADLLLKPSLDLADRILAAVAPPSVAGPMREKIGEILRLSDPTRPIEKPRHNLDEVWNLAHAILSLLSPAAPDAGGGEDRLQIAIEALERARDRINVTRGPMGSFYRTESSPESLYEARTAIGIALAALKPGGER